jgi:Flp pilus assembly pilin Flp
MLKALWEDEGGLTTVEYALVLVLVVIVGVTAWTTLGTNVKNKASAMANELN